VRWVPPGSLHLTLKFLGDIAASSVPQVAAAVQSAAGQASAFEVGVGGLGAFPNMRQPRVVWLGLHAPPALLELQRSLEAGLARLGYAPEGRAFSPHLTVGRVSRSAGSRERQALGRALAGETVGSLGVFRVDAVHLYQSVLQPGGAVYTKLHSGRLRGDVE
jgi:2'-5' RNA ligase